MPAIAKKNLQHKEEHVFKSLMVKRFRDSSQESLQVDRESLCRSRNGEDREFENLVYGLMNQRESLSVIGSSTSQRGEQRKKKRAPKRDS